jgi:hypothetical protein
VLGPTFIGTPWEKLGDTWSLLAGEILAKANSNYLRGISLTFDAVRMTAQWEPPDRILERAAEGFEILKKERGPVAWEQNMAFTAGLRVREQLGLFDELEQRGALWLGESTDRGDLFAQAMACQARAMSHLAGDMVEQSREFARRSVSGWKRGVFTVQHYYALRFEVQGDLIEGKFEDARKKMLHSWTALRRAQLLRHPISRPELLLLRGLVELAAGSARGARRCREAEKLGKELSGATNPVSRAHGVLLLAACASLPGPNENALRQIDIARGEYRRVGQVLQAECTELLLAAASDNAELREQVVRRLRSRGIKSPLRYLRAHVPFVFLNAVVPAIRLDR